MNKKIIKNIFTVLFITIIILMMWAIKANAETANLTASATTATVGDSVTINVTYTAAAWNLKVSGDGITGKTFASQTSDLSEESKSESFTLDTSKAGTYTISLTGDITNKDGNTTDVNKSVTVTVKEKETTSTGTATTPTTETSTVTPEKTKSSVATLRNMGITPNDFSGFKAGTLTYTAEVPYTTSKVNLYAYATDSNATVTGTGSKSLTVGENTFKVVVTAEDGTTTKTYTLTVKRLSEEETNKLNQTTETTNSEDSTEEADLTLSSLKIDGLTLTPSFSKETYKYSAKLTKDVDELEVTAEASDKNVTVEIEGNDKIKDGDNKIKIKLSSESGDTAEYTITVTKDLSEENKGLATLEIKGITLAPSFDPDVYNYVATLTEDLTELEVTALKADGTTDGIEVTGNEEIELGENTITILVTDEETGDILTYQIIITKELATNDTESKNGTNIGKIILAVAAVIIIIALIILLKPKKNKLDEENDEDSNDNFDDDNFNPFDDDKNQNEINANDNDVAENQNYNLNRNKEYSVFEDKELYDNINTADEENEVNDVEIEMRRNRLQGKSKGKHF
jgi:hypothetical protein